MLSEQDLVICQRKSLETEPMAVRENICGKEAAVKPTMHMDARVPR